MLRPIRSSSVYRLGLRWHIEGRRGTQIQAIDYCKKDACYISHGKPKIQGQRTDLDRIRGIAHEDGMRAVCVAGNLQQIRVAEKYLTYCEEPRDWKPNVTWIWGDSGTGKSRMARELCGEDVYTKNTGTKWWDGYDNHEDVIIDDFRDSWWPITYMLALLDRYEMIIEYKGGTRQFRPRNIIVTSIKDPIECYINTGECHMQLKRRIDKIIHLVSDVAEVGGVIV